MNARTVALVELASHNEVLSNYCKILNAAGFKILVFTNTFNRKQISLEFELEWVIQNETESNLQFVDKVKPQLNKLDLIIFTTIEREFNFFSNLDLIPPKLLVLHKLVMFVSPRKRFLLNRDRWQQVKDLVKIARYYFLYEKRRNLNFLQRFEGLILPSLQMQKYLKDQDWGVGLPSNLVIDFAVHENQIYRPSSSEVLVITIPGIISEKSRDYEVVLSAFEKFKPARKIELVLLGGSKAKYGRSVVSRFLALQSPTFEVRTYSKFVEQEEFDEVLQQSDMLLLPIAKYMKVSIFREINGFTCVSGNINDMLRYGIPALLPAYYPVQGSQADLIEVYENADDLANLLYRWIRDEIYLKKREGIGEVLTPFSPLKIAERIKAPLCSFIEAGTC